MSTTKKPDIQPQALVIFNRKSGKIKKNGILLGRSNALMRGYIFSNGLKASEDALIFGLEDGKVKFSFIGNEDFPEQINGSYQENSEINEICDGLLEQCRQMWKEEFSE